MKIKDYLDAEGLTGQEFASQIGVAPSYLSQMICGRRPWKPSYCTSIERITGDQVTRQDLRPDDYWLIWPDLPAPIGATHAAAGNAVQGVANA